jgi:16S rRNA (guanine527-N7)-methyltransferase
MQQALALDQLPPDQRQQLDRFLDLLIEANQRFNLTRIVDKADAETFHLTDALQLLPHLPTAKAGRFDLCDVGSGGGVPGIVLAVTRPNARVTLVESTGKKADFLQHVVDDLKLDHVEIYNGRAERMPRHGQHDVVTARAVASMAKLLPWCRPLVRRDGVFLAMKGPKASEELREAQPILQEQKASVTTHPYPLDGQSGRVIVKCRW